MTRSKTHLSAVDRRRFLEHTWQAVGASLSVALVSGRGLFAAPRLSVNDRRGYFKATVTRHHMELELRFMTSVEDPNGVGYTERSFFVEDGQPGVA